MSQKNQENTKTIGARFRSARSLVHHLNRKSFCERHDLNRYTMQSWENGLHVSKGKNVLKFIEALAAEGVYCTADWLIDGIGEPARPYKEMGAKGKPSKLIEKPSPESLAQKNTLQAAQSLILAYATHGQMLISHTIEDDLMRPNFSIGDMVFGVLLSGDHADIHQKFCLVEFGAEHLVLRKAIVNKDSVLLLALDERVPSFYLGAKSKIYQVLWHLIG